MVHTNSPPREPLVTDDTARVASTPTRGEGADDPPGEDTTPADAEPAPAKAEPVAAKPSPGAPPRSFRLLSAGVAAAFALLSCLVAIQWIFSSPTPLGLDADGALFSEAR